MTKVVNLSNRKFLKITGKDAAHFLQGLITNNIEKVNQQDAIYAALLNPQGRFLCDFFIAQLEDGFLLDVADSEFVELKQKLLIYKLRSEVDITDISDIKVLSIFAKKTEEILSIQKDGEAKQVGDNIVYVDPRSRQMGLRAYVQNEAEFIKQYGLEKVDFDEYEYLRYENAIAAGEADLEKEKSFILEYGFNELNAVDFNKGCYVGQEVTARTFHRGVIRKEIRKFEIDRQVTLPADAEITADGKKIGNICSYRFFAKEGRTIGLALIRKKEFSDNKSKKMLTCETEVRIS